MAHYRASLLTPLSRDEVFAYLSDFSTTEEWDPGVVEAQRLDQGELGEGSRFRLKAKFLGRTVPITYTIVEYAPGLAVGLRGESATVLSRDRISFESVGGGTQIVYDADLALKGPLRIADALLAVAFRGVGDRALAGLRERLDERAAAGFAREQAA